VSYDPVIDRVRDASDIVAVVGEYVRLQKRGPQYLGCCPFHTEKTASFAVQPEKQVYRCYGCDASGDVFTFLQKIEGLDFRGALHQLASRAGISIDPESPEERERREQQRRQAQLAAADCEWVLAMMRRTLARRAGELIRMRNAFERWSVKLGPAAQDNEEWCFWMRAMPWIERLGYRYLYYLGKLQDAQPDLIAKAYREWRAVHMRTFAEETAHERWKDDQRHWEAASDQIAGLLLERVWES
jgi:hypothetical protein